MSSTSGSTTQHTNKDRDKDEDKNRDRDRDGDNVMFTNTDLMYLRRAVELAREALEAGDAPFGSVLVYETDNDEDEDEEDGEGEDEGGDDTVEIRPKTKERKTRTKTKEARNQINTLADATRHPEFELARWSTTIRTTTSTEKDNGKEKDDAKDRSGKSKTNLTPHQRRKARVYTSGEHCAMCAAAHAWAGLGEVVYVASSAQLAGWWREFLRDEYFARNESFAEHGEGLAGGEEGADIKGLREREEGEEKGEGKGEGKEWAASPVAPLSVQLVAPRVPVRGPVTDTGLLDEVRDLYRREWTREFLGRKIRG